MGRTTESAQHEFFSCRNPTREWAKTLRLLLELGDPDRSSQDWIEILCVENGVVDWKFDEGGKRWNRCLYGERELASLGEATGFLIRHVVQFGWDDDEVDAEEKQRSWSDYHSLALWLTQRPL